MAGKPRCVKLHIHTSVRVSYTTIHCINVPVKSKFQHPPRAYPGHLMPFLAREGGNLITTHRGVGNLIASLDVTLRDKSWQRRQTLMN